MKNILALLTFLFTAAACYAQDYVLKQDTIKVAGHPYALYRKGHSKTPKYFISTLKGDELIVAYPGREKVEGKTICIVTFLNNKKQGMLLNGNDVAGQLIKEVIKYDLVTNGATVSVDGEAQFILAHPLPAGYVDAEQLSEYGML